MVFPLSKMKNRIRSVVEGPIRLLYPEACQVCAESSASPQDGFICENCLQGISRIKFPYCNCCGLPFEGDLDHAFQCPNCHEVRLYFETARSACVANSLMLDLLHRYKYGHARWLEPLFERLLGEAVSNQIAADEYDLVIPLPLHPVRKRERGFNQSGVLARNLAKRIQLPCVEDAVKRVAHTQSQTMLTRKERAANVAQAFEVVDGKRIKNRRVLLIDDVLTTGATASECARVCLQAGCDTVNVWTLARGLGIVGQ